MVMSRECPWRFVVRLHPCLCLCLWGIWEENSLREQTRKTRKEGKLSRMLSVFCGRWAQERRARELEELASRERREATILVVPGEYLAAATRQRLAHDLGVLPARCVSSWEEFCERVRVPRGRILVGSKERRAVVRSILLAHPEEFPMFVLLGEGPRGAVITSGTLTRLSAVVERAAWTDYRHELAESESPYHRQLLLLAQRYSQRLAYSGGVSAFQESRNSWRELAPEDFQRIYPGVSRVVFDGFDAPDELLLEAVSKLRGLVQECVVLVECDPATIQEKMAHLEAGYKRLVELADTLEGDGEPLAAEPAAPITVVHAPSREAEVRSIAAFLREKMVEASHDGREFAYGEHVVCFPRMEPYSALVRDVFRDYNLPYELAAGRELRKQPLWSLVERLATLVASDYALVALRFLTQTPLLQRSEAAHIKVDGPVLERAWRETNFSGTGREFVPHLRHHIGRLERLIVQEQKAAAEAEEDNELLRRLRRDVFEFRLLEQTLGALFDCIAPLDERRALREWGEVLEAVLDCLSAESNLARGQGYSLGEISRFHMSRGEILAGAQRVAQCSKLLGSGSLGFSDYVAILEIFVADKRLPDHLPAGGGIRICGLEEARGFRPEVLVIGGMVEGELPHTAREAGEWSGEESARPGDEEAQLARQWFDFEQLLRGARQKSLLYVPATDAEEQLLESQFIEELASWQGVEHVEAKQLHAARRFPVLSSGELFGALAVAVEAAPQQEGEAAGASASKALAGGFTPQEEAVLGNCAWNIAANDERTRLDAFGVFDGFVSEPALVKLLERRAAEQVYSASMLDLLVLCRFRYFIDRILKIQAEEVEEEGTVSASLVGQIVHTILFRFYSRWVSEGRGLITAFSRRDAQQLMMQVFETVMDESPLVGFARELVTRKLLGFGGRAGFLGEQAAEPAVESTLRGHVGLLGAFLALEVERSQANPELARPRHFELGFGLPARGVHDEQKDEASTETPVAVKMEEFAVQLRGRVDRVDVSGNLFSLVDYKTGGVPTISAQRQGYRVQLPVYLMALERLFAEQGRELVGAGGLFYQLRQRKAEVRGQFFRKMFRQIEAFGERATLLGEEEYEAALELVRKRIAGGISAVRKGQFYHTQAEEALACTWCACSLVCRRDLIRSRRLVPAVVPEPERR